MCASEHVFSIDRLVMKSTFPVRNINQFTCTVVELYMFLCLYYSFNLFIIIKLCVFLS